MPNPEQEARKTIDDALAAAGWLVQDANAVNLTAGRGIAIREYPLNRGFSFADYLLYVDGKALGVIEAKPVGVTLIGVEVQAEKYSVGLPSLPTSALSPFSMRAPALRRASRTCSTLSRAAVVCSTSIGLKR